MHLIHRGYPFYPKEFIKSSHVQLKHDLFLGSLDQLHQDWVIFQRVQRILQVVTNQTGPQPLLKVQNVHVHRLILNDCCLQYQRVLPLIKQIVQFIDKEEGSCMILSPFGKPRAAVAAAIYLLSKYKWTLRKVRQYLLEKGVEWSKRSQDTVARIFEMIGGYKDSWTGGTSHQEQSINNTFLNVKAAKKKPKIFRLFSNQKAYVKQKKDVIETLFHSKRSVWPLKIKRKSRSVG